MSLLCGRGMLGECTVCGHGDRRLNAGAQGIAVCHLCDSACPPAGEVGHAPGGVRARVEVEVL